jgi:hypothetical protein
VSAPAPLWLQGEGTFGGRSCADRAETLAPSDRAHYRHILEWFIAGQRQPTDPPPSDVLARLTERDLIQVDSGRTITVAYPFSAERTRHQVALAHGRSYYAMCAIDALAVPYMLHEPGEVKAREPRSERMVRVAVDTECEPTPAPASAVVVAAFGDGSCLAQAACPHINLFTSRDAAADHLEAEQLKGHIISITDATAAGRWLFGDLIDRLSATEQA